MDTAGTVNVDPGEDASPQTFVLEEFKHLKEVKDIIEAVPNTYKDTNSREIAEDRFKFIFDQYQEQPHLLDAHIESILQECISIIRTSDADPKIRHMIFRLMFLIVKTRGYKSVIRLMPHEVGDLEPTLRLLAEHDPSDSNTWATPYILLLWLSIVCMIPFDLSRLDAGGRKPILDRVIDAAKVYLPKSSKPQQAAAFFLAKLHSRPDVVQRSLSPFIDWCCAEMSRIQNEEMMEIIYLTGILRCLAHLFKFGKREDLLPYANKMLLAVQQLSAVPSENMLVTKLQSKLLQRIGLVFLPPHVVSWRYQRGNRSLLKNLAPKGCGDAKGAANGSSYLDHRPNDAEATPSSSVTAEEEEEEEEDVDVPDEVAEIIDHLLTALRNRDTIVRWSAAKGIGRLCNRLPRSLVNDVVSPDALLSVFSRLEGHAAWHGGCLALAELARRGLLLPSRLEDVIPHILSALIYEERSGDCSLGSNVRDAACYVCWAFARAYDPDELSNHVISIASSLVLVSLFDREVNVRRAASAAFQENVGRQGHFPHGIDILTHLDYFAVGNRQACYLEHSTYVAQFSEYVLPMVNHLIDNKLGHWDASVRELASQTLNRLTAFCPDFMLQEALPRMLTMCTGTDLYRRHGAIHGVAEVIHALNKPSDLSGAFEEQIKDITIQLTERKMFLGLAGEFMRKACCCLIERCSRISMPYHHRPYGDALLENWSMLLDESLQHREVPVQDAAVAALPCFLSTYYDIEDPERVEIAKKYIDDFTEHALDCMTATNLECIRSGFCRAVGALSSSVLKEPERLQRLTNALITCTQTSVRTLKWAHSRRLAVQALASVASKTIMIMPEELVQRIGDGMLNTFHDYTVDARGDIGAIVREAGMTSFADLCQIIIKNRYEGLEASFFTKERVSRLMCDVLQQAQEKIDRTRGVAAHVFISILHKQDRRIPNIPHVDDVLAIFTKEVCEQTTWTNPVETFKWFSKLIPLKTYQRSLLLGLTVSVGGLTESTVRHSSDALQEILSSISKDGQEAMETVVDNIIDIYLSSAKEERLVIPMMKFLDFLLNRTAVSECLLNSELERSERLLHLTKAAISRSREVHKIIAAIDVFCSLLQFPSLKRGVLSTLMPLLCHRYPVIRKAAATKLYEALLSYEDVISEEKVDDAMNVLIETVWEEDLETIRPIRNSLCDILGVTVPKIVPKSSPTSSEANSSNAVK